MTKNISGQDTLNLAKEVLTNTDKEKYPKLYESREATVRALEVAHNQKVRAEKAEKKTLKNKEAKPSKKQTDKKEGFDYAEKAYLKTSDVNPDEFELVEKIMSDTGKTLDEVLESKYFRAELKEKREAKASIEAVPKGTKRSTPSSRGEVDYWIAKGEMPPADQPKLRREYVNAKIKAKTSGSKFSKNPVIQ